MTLELARQAYEDIETFERAMSDQLDLKPKTTKVFNKKINEVKIFTIPQPRNSSGNNITLTIWFLKFR